MSLGILVVEDSSTMRQVAQIAFAGTSHQVWVVSSVAEAKTVLAGKKVDLAIVDAGLSQDAAYGFVQSVRQERGLQSPRFLLWTSQYHPLQETLAAQVGVDSFINKPFEIQVLLEKIDGLFAAAQVASHTQVGIPVARPVPPVAPVFASPLLTPTPVPSRPAEIVPIAPVVIQDPTVTTTSAVQASAWSSAEQVSPSDTVVTPSTDHFQIHVPAVTPEMPRVPFLPRAPVPVSVIAALEALAKKGSEYREVGQVSREVIERIAWEVVPALAEVLLQEEIRRRMAEQFRQKEEVR